ncbi:diguanylate cyclase [Anaeromyxobacter paludicola]|uniref:diguanylate cyclase n=1 Tax=Anaeromyxobacter paludicola TaxID=2918171 RepID=A0ABM7X5Y8_9BACT|nr:diguanylate cyclase [Anaeromyxobacter paludicola]BDG07230.1 diguanylate cyclase response regulator [Anaeromyxobacter paludicola]
MAHSVLLVDDERFARTVYSDYLRATGYEVAVAEDAAAALEALRARRFDVLITDVILPGSDGLELLAAAKQLDPDIEALVITALDRVDPAVRAMKSGASDYLVKPVTPEALQVAVQRCLSTRALLAENKALRAHLQLFETCQRLAASMERDKLVQMALAAVASECGGRGAVLLERTRAGAVAAAGRHALGDAEAEALVAASAPRLAGLSPAEPTVLPAVEGMGVPVLFPVTDGQVVLAVAAVIAPAPPTAERLGGAQFVCRHFGLALRTFGQLKQVEHLAYLDDLTHLYNVRFLDLALEREIQNGRPFTVLFMDLDRFKSVNDTHGHLNGSKLLVEVARVLKACVRDDDVVARYGGDEYVAVLMGIDSGVGLKVAERIRRAIEDHVFLSRESARVHITASIGLASFPEHTRDKAEVLDLADRAMYRGKRSTRNVVYLASKDLPPAPAR